MGSILLKKETPEFQSDAEESAWRDSIRDLTDAWMREAIANRQKTTLAAVLAKARRNTAAG